MTTVAVPTSQTMSIQQLTGTTKMTKATISLAALALGASLLTGCAPMISGAMNATLSSDSIVQKTADYFGGQRDKVVISDVKNDVLSTSYKAHYAGKGYNCSIYYGEVKCNAWVATANDVAVVPAPHEKVQQSTASTAQNEMSVMQAQTRLNQLGYSVGKPDGVFGNRSKAKLKLFQKSSGLQVTGVLDAQTVDALRQ